MLDLPDGWYDLPTHLNINLVIPTASPTQLNGHVPRFVVYIENGRAEGLHWASKEYEPEIKKSWGHGTLVEKEYLQKAIKIWGCRAEALLDPSYNEDAWKNELVVEV